ncbi:MAG TPA: PAS domain S-box protein [Thiobacillaceae bacterium]|nr:PAS domain S-box protein [Thiobacillaceae bacterium]
MPRANMLQVNPARATPSAVPDVPDGRPSDLAALTLDDLGFIRDCSSASEQIFGYVRDALIGAHVSMLLPQLADTDLVQEGRINSRLAFLCHCAFIFEARRHDGGSFDGELFISRLDIHNVVILVRNLGAERVKGGMRAVKPLQ